MGRLRTLMSKVGINVVGSAGKIAEAITALVTALSKYMGKANLRRMKKCIRLGDRIVDKVWKLELDDKEHRVLAKLLRQWDKYNN